jgi:hypothetical protein
LVDRVAKSGQTWGGPICKKAEYSLEASLISTLIHFQIYIFK